MSMITGLIGYSNRNVRRIELKNADGTSAGAITIAKSEKKKKKKLQYNFKYISRQIMQAKTSANARQVTASARQNAVSLRRRLGSGDYDERELQSAILHAEAMVRVAKKRMKHLQQEENVKAKADDHNHEYEDGIDIDVAEEPAVDDMQTGEPAGYDIGAMRERLKEYREIMQRTMQDLMQDMMEDVADVSGSDMEELAEELILSVDNEVSPQKLELLKKKHRSEELRDIMEADMKYLKAMFDRLEKEKRDAGSSVGSNAQGAALELGGVEIPVQVMEPPMIPEGGNIDTIV